MAVQQRNCQAQKAAVMAAPRSSTEAMGPGVVVGAPLEQPAPTRREMAAIGPARIIADMIQSCRRIEQTRRSLARLNPFPYARCVGIGSRASSSALLAA